MAQTDVVIASYPSLLEAELVRGRLESAEIPARLKDAHTASMASHLSVAIGGVKVVVHQDDVEEAQALLKAPIAFDDDDDAAAALVDSHTLGRADDAARWALRLSWLGLMVPVVGHLGVALMAYRATTLAEEGIEGTQLTPWGRGQLRQAALWTGAGLISWGLVWWLTLQ